MVDRRKVYKNETEKTQIACLLVVNYGKNKQKKLDKVIMIKAQVEHTDTRKAK